jgi:hypothetical protein
MRYIPKKGRKYIEKIKTKLVRASLSKRFCINAKKNVLAIFALGTKLALPSPNRESH